MPRVPAHRGWLAPWKEINSPNDPVRSQRVAGKVRAMIVGRADRAAGAMIAVGGTTAASTGAKDGNWVRAAAGRVSRAGRRSRCHRAIPRRCRRR